LRLRWGEGVEGSERLAEPVGLAGELVKTLLDLLTQAVDHGSVSSSSGGERC